MFGGSEWKYGCSWLCTAVSSALHSAMAKHTSLVGDSFLQGLYFSAKAAEQVHLSTLFYSYLFIFIGISREKEMSRGEMEM